MWNIVYLFMEWDSKFDQYWYLLPGNDQYQISKILQKLHWNSEVNYKIQQYTQNYLIHDHNSYHIYYHIITDNISPVIYYCTVLVCPKLFITALLWYNLCTYCILSFLNSQSQSLFFLFFFFSYLFLRSLFSLPLFFFPSSFLSLLCFMDYYFYYFSVRFDLIF